MTDSIFKKSSIINAIEKNKVVAVVRADNAQKTIDIAKALIEGGMKVLELSIDYKNAPSAINEISKIDDIFVTAGSVVTTMQADKVIASGARLISSPVLEQSLIKWSKGPRIPLITGASTSNEAYEAWKYGVDIVKIFPAKALGGPDYLKDVLTAMPFLKLMPAGRVGLDDFTDYLKVGAVAVSLGKAFYEEEQDFKVITKRAKEVVKKLEEYV